MLKLYLLLLLIFGILLVSVPIVILYFIIKRAVRNGILEAREIIEEKEDCIK